MKPEDKARLEIDRQLEQAGWIVQDHREMNLSAGPGVAVAGSADLPSRKPGIEPDASTPTALNGKAGCWRFRLPPVGKRRMRAYPEGVQLRHFDAFLIGLTATPTHPYDGLPRPSHTTALEGRVTHDRRTRKTLYRELDDDLTYTANQLDRDVVNRDQLRLVIRTFRDRPTRTTDFRVRRKPPPGMPCYALRTPATLGKGAGRLGAHRDTETITPILHHFPAGGAAERVPQLPRIAVTVDMIATVNRSITPGCRITGGRHGPMRQFGATAERRNRTLLFGNRVRCCDNRQTLRQQT